MSRRQSLILALGIGLFVGIAFVIWRGNVIDNPLNPQTLSVRSVGPNDCVDAREVGGPALELTRATDCTEPHDAEVLTSATLNASAASYARGLGIVEWCRESAFLQLSVQGGQGDAELYAVRAATDGAEPERPASGDTVACLAQREDGKKLTAAIP